MHSALEVYSEENINSSLADARILVVMDAVFLTIVNICDAHIIKNVRNTLRKITDDTKLAELLTRCFSVKIDCIDS